MNWTQAIIATTLFVFVAITGCIKPTEPEQEAEIGAIIVNSTPEGADIWLDDQSTGKVTPDTLDEVSLGSHEITLTLEDHFDWVGTVNVEKDIAAVVEAVLLQHTGAIIVNSTPEGADIWLDDQSTGKVTPDTLDEVSLGLHRVKVVLTGYIEYTGVVNIYDHNDTTSINITLKLACPGGIIGDTTLAPEIEITTAESGSIRGIANNIDASKTRVVLWALTNIWYVQPYVSHPFTAICGDGSWQNRTHSWKRMVALLVNDVYYPGTTRYTHPGLEANVLAWDQVPEARPDMPLSFSGRLWGIKVSEDRFDPGPNYFSDSPENVWVDEDGQLHLKIVFQNNRWTTPEVHLLESLGYGEYTFQLTSRVDSLDYRAVFGAFVYESGVREIDIEFSQILARPDNAQYVVQPYYRSGNIVRFPMPATEYSTHRFVWREDRIEFTSWQGLEENPDSITYSWVYTGGDIPPPGRERMRFNLWLFGGNPPLSGQGDEVIIKSFRHTP